MGTKKLEKQHQNTKRHKLIVHVSEATWNQEWSITEVMLGNAMGLTVQNSVPVWWYTMPLIGEQMCSKDIQYSLGVDLGRTPKPSTLPCSTKSTANPSHFFSNCANALIDLVQFHKAISHGWYFTSHTRLRFSSKKNLPLERAILHGKCVSKIRLHQFSLYRKNISIMCGGKRGLKLNAF